MNLEEIFGHIPGRTLNAIPRATREHSAGGFIEEILVRHSDRFSEKTTGRIHERIFMEFLKAYL